VGAWNFAPEEDSCITVENLTKKAIQTMNNGSYHIQKDGSKHEMKILKLDATKAKTKLGWKSLMNIDKSLDWTFEWYKSYYNKKDMSEITKNQIAEIIN